ncbi:hypothetical protein [Streptomyces sp. NPDC051218]|uniref:hypothetical protein n=1 Tax=Streptomyces sp. NPDC051218 TaxID=3365645 RepID=UPI00378B521A
MQITLPGGAQELRPVLPGGHCIMGSISVAVTAAAAAAILSSIAPAAQAIDSSACGQTEAAAQQAHRDYLPSLKAVGAIVDGGGHPDRTQRDSVDQLKSETASLSAQVAHCPHTRQMPTVTTHAGLGGPDQERYGPAVIASTVVALAGAYGPAMAGSALVAVAGSLLLLLWRRDRS